MPVLEIFVSQIITVLIQISVNPVKTFNIEKIDIEYQSNPDRSSHKKLRFRFEKIIWVFGFTFRSRKSLFKIKKNLFFWKNFLLICFPYLWLICPSTGPMTFVARATHARSSSTWTTWSSGSFAPVTSHSRSSWWGLLCALTMSRSTSIWMTCSSQSPSPRIISTPETNTCRVVRTIISRSRTIDAWILSLLTSKSILFGTGNLNHL